MSLTDFFKTQQKIENSLYPTVVSELIESQRKWKKILEFSPLKDLKPVVELWNIESYCKTFNEIESINKQFNIFGINNSVNKFSFINYDLSGFTDEVQEEEIEEVKNVIIDQSKNIKRIITDIYKDNTNLLKIEPRQFEEMIAEILYSKGFEVELTKQTRDNGFDILALKIIENNFPLKFLVECKKFTKNKVGVEIIRGFKEVVESQNANKGIIVTTSYFTKPAHDKRLETPYKLEYKDKDDVLKWVEEYCNN